jgi:hypothetical protein
MKPRILPLVEQCVEAGVTRGYRLAHKHVDSPSEEAIIERITSAVMAEFHEWFTFNNDGVSGLDL